MEFALQVTNDPMAVRAARAELRAWLAGASCGHDCIDNAEIVMSELVTNAMLHAGTGPRLTAARASGCIHLEVHDPELAPPALHAPQGAAGGYGLHIVDRLSIGWGWQPTPSGKFVWADVAL